MNLYPHQKEALKQTEGKNRVAILGYEGLYEIDMNGNVYSILKTNSRRIGIVKPFINNSGYFRIALYDILGRRRVYYVHRLVAFTFIKNPMPDKQRFVNHKDGNKENNSVENLEWCTQKENIRHSWEHGLQSGKGEKHGCAKLKQHQVNEIRENKFNLSQKELALKYHVSQPTISAILRNKLWKEGD